MIATSLSLLASSAAALALSLSPGEGAQGPLTLEEMRAQATERFAKMDTNDDGYVSEEDKPDPAARFAMVDADNSGTVTLDEMTAGALDAFDERDTNGNGTIDEEERGDPGKRRGGRKGENRRSDRPAMTRENVSDMVARRFDRMDKDGNGELSAEEFSSAERGRRGPQGDQRRSNRGGVDMMKADANGDGRISLEEHLTTVEERFAKMDTDGNGVVSEEERRATKKTRRGKE
ncbi:MAG: hypothetical protein AAGA69_03180 [Pseudomonadota bacterium]